MAYKDEILLSLPKAYWRLGEASGATVATDETGNHPGGTYFDLPALGVAGLLSGDSNTAMQLDGVSNARLDTGLVLPLTDEFSLTWWMQPNSQGEGGFGRIVSSESDTGGWGLYFSDASTLRVRCPPTATVDMAAGGSLVGVVSHCALISRAGRLQLYVNGELTADVAAPTYATSGQALQIGNRPDLDRAFDGVLDEPAIYPRALTAWEIRRHYWAGKGKSGYALEVLSGGPAYGWLLDGSDVAAATAPIIAGGAALTPTGTITYGAEPLIAEGNALATATDAYLIGSAVPSWTSGALTAEIWFAGTSAVAQSCLMYGNTGASSSYKWILGYYPQASGFVCYYANGANVTVPVNLIDGQPHHVVMVMDPAATDGTLKVYVDGTLAFSGNHVTAVSSGTNCVVGRWNNSLPGSYDAPMVYQRALTATEIRRHYQRGLGKTGYALEVLSGGPLTYWRLGDAAGATAAADEMGLLPATLRNTPTLEAPGLLAGDTNRSIIFDGINDFLTTGASAVLPKIATRGVSAEFFFKAAGSSVQCLFAWRTPTGESNADSQGLVVAINVGVAGAVYLARGDTSTTWAGPVNDNAVHHAVATVADSGLVSLYIDGVLRASLTPLPEPNTTDDALINIGANQGSDGSQLQYFAGTIDEVAVYTRALTTDEIARHYAMGRYGEGAALLGYLAGTVTLDGSPAAVLVRAFRWDTGELLGEATSDPADGSYTIADIAYSGECLVVAQPGTGFRPLAHGPIIPESSQ